jgi:hypothetical protein
MELQVVRSPACVRIRFSNCLQAAKHADAAIGISSISRRLRSSSRCPIPRLVSCFALPVGRYNPPFTCSNHRSFRSRAAATSRGSFFTDGLIPVLSDIPYPRLWPPKCDSM